MGTVAYDVALDGAFVGRVAIAVRAAYAATLDPACWPRESYTVLWGDAPTRALHTHAHSCSPSYGP